MIDIKLIRENPEKVRAALLKRMDALSFDELLLWDGERRDTIQKSEALKNERNVVSSEIAKMKKGGLDASEALARMKAVGEEIAGLDRLLADLNDRIHAFMSGLPNIPDDDVPAGGKESSVTLRVWGEKPSFGFPAKNHIELCESLGLIDYPRGVKLSGAGHWVYRGMGARLEWALLNFFVREHIADGYEFLLLPHILNYRCGYVAGQFPKFMADDYWIDGGPDEGGKFLLPTAETALINYHCDEILDEKDLPRKYFSYSPCFRREAGSTRAEERGMIRGHQFNKVEIVQFAHPDHSGAAFDELTRKAESLVQKLGLHYRLSQLAAEDCSSAMGRTYDIEIWIPSMGIYKEVSSASNAYDYQARRGRIRFRDGEGGTRLVHTLNASGLATSRLMPAIVEQFQREDGSVAVPEALRGDVGTDRICPQDV
ncbi:MAG: serine--tRNA ligase [Clostridiales Family XIII bacterium]|jgi:seryl-tRNA synthetase|nr:serine--tRNA ligase [Clostridiales Family XIII bacterium]